MGASVTPDIPWDGRGTSTPRSEEPGFGLIHRKFVKVVLPLSEWIAGSTAPPAQAAYGTDMPRCQPFATSDEITYLWDLPNDLDRAQPIKFQIVFAVKTADYDVDFTLLYSALAPGDDLAAGATALDTTIPVTTDGATGDDGMIRQLYVGEIAANTLNSDEELMALLLTCSDDGGTNDHLCALSIRVWYERALV